VLNEELTAWLGIEEAKTFKVKDISFAAIEFHATNPAKPVWPAKSKMISPDILAQAEYNILQKVYPKQSGGAKPRTQHF
jgi:hypothetical protein